VAFQSLYRKYRPQRFDELVGQEHVSSALRNAVREDRVGHAYLFSGPRGTGKTTSARILAKALNCTERAADGEPCGKCDACLSVTAGTSFDVIEIDAASNNGVDEMRDLIEKVAYRSAGGGRKVYIIDEVHELTGRASNALLKTLEEPPDHVVFVLATTNPEKVLPTIRSRTQHFEFTLLTQDQLVGHLGDVLAHEGIEASPEALVAVARRGAGSVRDALSLLDQAIAHGALDAEGIASLFGGAPFERRLAILQAITNEDPAGALVELDGLLESGHDARRIADDLLRVARDVFVVTAAAGRVRVDLPEAEIAQLQALGQTLGSGGAVRIIETLGRSVVDMRGTDTTDPRLVLEVAVVTLARRDGATSLQGLADRIERLERSGGASAAPASAPAAERPAPRAAMPEQASAPTAAVAAAAAAGGGPSGAKAALGALRGAAKESAPAKAAKPTPTPAPAEPVTAAPVPAGPLDLDAVIAAWPAALDELPIATKSSVQDAQPIGIEDGNVIVFGVPSSTIEAAKPRFQRAATPIREALASRLGREPRFKLVVHDDPATTNVMTPEDAVLEDALDASEVAELEMVDKNDPANSSVGRLLESFGGEVIDEQPR